MAAFPRSWQRSYENVIPFPVLEAESSVPHESVPRVEALVATRSVAVVRMQGDTRRSSEYPFPFDVGGNWD